MWADQKLLKYKVHFGYFFCVIREYQDEKSQEWWKSQAKNKVY